MKMKSILEIILGVVFIAIVGLFSFKTLAKDHFEKNQTEKHRIDTYQLDKNISITINSKTSSGEISSIQNELKSVGINASFENIVRNDMNEITSIDIRLNDENGGLAHSSISSNKPIPEMTFGYEQDQLFIKDFKSNRNYFEAQIF